MLLHAVEVYDSNSVLMDTFVFCRDSDANYFELVLSVRAWPGYTKKTVQESTREAIDGLVTSVHLTAIKFLNKWAITRQATW